MKKVFHEISERMEENELYGTIGFASIKAFLTIIALFLVGYFVLPFFATGKPTIFSISFITTFLTMVYVFKVKRGEYDRIFECGVGSFGYSTILYFFGELIFIGLMLLGILIVVSFIVGDGALTGLYTYLDLKKWLIEKREEEKIQSEDAVVQGGEVE